MCLDILKNPAKSLATAKKQKRMGKALTVAVESSILLGIAGAAIISGLGASVAGLIATGVTVFFSGLIAILLFGIIVHISASTLGGKGKYFEGLTSVAYAAFPISLGLLIASLLSVLPYTIGLQIISVALSFALGLSLLYRGIKDLFGVDTVTSLIIVSVSMIAIIAAVYVSIGISLVGQFPLVG